MKWKYTLLAVFLAWILPWGMMLTAESILFDDNYDSIQVDTVPLSLTLPCEPNEANQLMITVQQKDGIVVDMNLEDYLICVVLAEMPAEFEEDALKAQAVAARTYCLKRATTGFKHDFGAVCTESSCCQAFRQVHEYIQEGGKESDLEKIRTAVNKTQGQVLTYDGNLIEATYYSCSGGMTEEAAAVWGTEIPYLIALPSPGEEAATYYVDTVTFTLQQFISIMGCEEDDFSIEGITYTAGGGVDRIRIGGKEYTGTEVRKLLGLRSTAFVITKVDDSVIITTKGFGHRVGMSQYGADAMAVQGNDYTQILAYYYPGTTLELWHE